MITDLPESVATSMASSLQHLELLRRKQAKLAEATREAFVQMLHRIGTSHRCGELTDAQLARLFTRVQEERFAGVVALWDASVAISYRKMQTLVAQLPNGPEGSWVGEQPLSVHSPAPAPGASVVYVLFDAANEPVYVGSTKNFRSRLREHHRDGKTFARWQAHPCRDREHAYRLEDRLLREHLPQLNRKAGR